MDKQFLMTLQPNAKKQKKIKKVSYDKIPINKNSPSMSMDRPLNRILLLAALSFSTQLFCSDYDIFKEMVRFQDNQEQPRTVTQSPVSDECAWIAALTCREKIRAYNLAWRGDTQNSIAQMEECLWSVPCARNTKIKRASAA